MAAATIMSQVACTTGAKLGFGLQGRLSAAGKTSKFCSGTSSPRLMTSLAGRVRCDARDNGTGLREAVDQATKKTITKEDILRNQETNESEKKSVFGTEPTSGSLYPRPEVERRPETGDKSFTSLFAFDGAAPETINGRLVRMTCTSWLMTLPHTYIHAQLIILSEIQLIISLLNQSDHV